MTRLQAVLASIDAANGEDPSLVNVEGRSVARELLYGQRMSGWLSRLEPEASEVLQIAARGQHIRRWVIPRSDYPMDRAGYLKWRTTLYRFHADQLEPLMQEGGYPDMDIQRMRGLVEKRGIKSNPEAQTLEDVICLVFLEFYFDDFRGRHERSKVVDIVRKTWGKMSDRGQGFALQLPLDSEALSVVKEALGV
ncbi:MAG TPA: DUF4202 domain-containing protein [Methylococcaceae bacterium]|jgi:hypothetical protein|nr:DUF4202 domain-containing protein [Methylococcaceae bacterium]